MYKNKTAILGLLLILIFASASGCISGQNTIKPGILTIGICPQYPPTAYEENGELMGFDIDLLTELAKRMNLKPEFKVYSSKAELFDELASNHVDCLGSRTITQERRGSVDFTRIYYYDYVRIAVLEDSSVNSIKELNNGKLGVVKSTVSSELIDVYLTNIDCEFVYYCTPEDVAIAAQNGEIEAVIGHEMYIGSVSEKYGIPIRYLDEKMAVSYWAIPVNKNNPELRSSLNDALLGMENDGTLDELKLKWYGKY